jgi:AcrR family transcriptional regulator
MAAGAVAGAAAGLYLGRRYRSLDAFLADMRGRLAGLRDIWLDDELASDDDRVRLDADAELDEEDGDEEAFDELVEDKPEGTPLGAEGALDDEDDEDVIYDEDEDEDGDEFEADLADITSANGVPEASTRAADVARRLEERVLRALSDEPDLGTRAIEIAVVGDGVVELTGTVRAIEEISRASALVRKVPGVNMVLNRIDVRTGGHIDTASVPRHPVEEPIAEGRREPNA